MMRRRMQLSVRLALAGVVILGCLSTLGVGADSGSAADSPLLGDWLTENEDAKVRLEACGNKLCGRLVWLEDPLDETGQPDLDDKNPDPSLRDRPVLGLVILRGFDLRPDDGARWTGGSIYDPESGKTYKAQLELEGDVLAMRGYVGLPLFGRTSQWTRTDAAGTID